MNDVQKVDKTYNRNYLRAEYNFVSASAEMAGRWEQFEKDGDRYLLQYRTVGDERVRQEHASLNRVTLPLSSSFWDEHFVPNGWNCRCTVVQVRKGKYPETDLNEAYQRAEASSAKDPKGMFRFNAGKEGKAIPDYNPYTISKCKTCPVAKGKGKSKLAKFIPDSDVCAGCAIVRKCAGDHTKSQSAIQRKHYLHEMEHLLRKKEVKILTDGRRIRVGFRKDGNEHLYSDTFGRSKILRKEDLKDLDKLLRDATFVKSAPLYKQRKDKSVEFYYFEAKLRSEKVLLNVAKRVYEKQNGKVEIEYYLYAVNDIKKQKRRSDD